MSEISLRAYIDYIQDRLSRDAYIEVVAQSRHVLENYSRYIAAYKLLARALLEQENYQDATDLFQRVLSADPNDFIAHIGISACHHEGGALDQAIWHLERAYEQVPNNAELQAEIKRLYAERDGSPPRKVHLTAGALARLYMNGKLYPQAILELRKALARDPERPDLQVLLAEALWQDHQQVEAGELAANVLKRLPNSIDANRILAQLWLHAGQPREAEPFLERLDALDPYLGYSIRHDGKQAPTDAFKLEMLDFTAERQASEVGAAEWVSQIRAVEKSDAVTGTLKEAAEPVTNIFNDDPQEDAPAPSSRQPEESSIPDWLQGAYTSSLEASETEQEELSPQQTGSEPSLDIDSLFDGSSSSPQDSAEPAADEDAEPDWLADVLSAPAQPSGSRSGDTPDWLDDIIGMQNPPPSTIVIPATGDEEDTTPPTKPLNQPLANVERSAAGDDTPEWLQDILGDKEVEAAAPEPEPESVEAPPEPEATSDDEPNWLTDVLSEAPEAEAETQISTAPTGEQDAPEWLDDILAGRESEPPAAEEAPETPSVVSTDWLDQLISSESDEDIEDMLAETEAEPVPDWLHELDQQEPDDTEMVVDFGELEPWDADELEEAGPAPTSEADQSGLLAAAQRHGMQVETDQADVSPTETNDREAEVPSAEPRPEAGTESQASALQEEQQVTPPIEEPTGDENPQDDIPDWLLEGDLDNSEGAIAWLEELAAKYDPDFQKSEPKSEEPAEPQAEAAGPPPEEVKSPEEQSDVVMEEDGDFPDWLTGAPAPAAQLSEDDEDIPDWLRDEEETPAARAVSRLEENEEPEEWISRAPGRSLAGTEPEAEAADDWLSEEPAASAEAEEAPDELDWLTEKPAASAEAAAAATPAPAAPEAEPAGEDELPDWLRDLREPEKSEEDDLDWLYESIDEEQEGEAVTAPAASTEDLPDWLSEMGEAEAEAAPAAEAAEEDAFEWLDEQVEEQGISADEVVSEALSTDTPPTQVEPVAREDDEAAPVSEEEMPEWLKDMKASGEMERAMQEEVEPEAELEAELLSAADLEVGEDDLAWLDSALETEEVTLSDEDLDKMFAEQEAEEAPAAEAEAEPAEAEEAAQPAAGEEEPEAPVIAAAAGLPDWLQPSEEAEEEAELATAEEQPTAITEPTPTELAEEEPAEEAIVEAEPEEEAIVAVEETTEPEPAEAAPAAEVEEAEEEEEEEPEPAMVAIGGDAHERLRVAREKLALDFDEAIPYYESLIEDGEMLEQTVADLNYYLRSAQQPDLRARRVLGDAYREQGELGEALAAYRAALDEL